MNEKLLKDLWHKTVMDPNNKDGDDHRVRFAELIVAECIASIPLDGHRGDFGRAVEFCQQQIKQHFGVEE